MDLREPRTVLAGETLDTSVGGDYPVRKIVALSPVGYGSKCCGRARGNTTGLKMDYATTGVYAANGSTAADVTAFTPFPYGLDKVTVPAGASPVICWLAI